MRELFGKEMTVEEPVGTVRELLDSLTAKEPAVREIEPFLLFSINQKRAGLDDEISDGDVVALFFMPSGG
jgi:molybdopterin converting factor small subunit